MAGAVNRLDGRYTNKRKFDAWQASGNGARQMGDDVQMVPWAVIVYPFAPLDPVILIINAHEGFSF